MAAISRSGEVVVFFTGGTIGMSPAPGVPGVAPGGNFDRLLNELAPQPDGISLRPVLWSDKPSPHMTPEDMFRLAKDIQTAVDEKNVLGAVVLHGTDVLVESAFMADLTVQSPKPVLLTGSMRYYSESGYDGLRNLINAVRAVLLPLPAGTGVCVLMTDRIFAAREAVKVNSLNVDAFESREAGVIGYVAGESVVLAGCPLSSEPGLKLCADRIEPNVPLLTSYTGMDSSMIDFALQNGAKGLVIEGFGAGNVPPRAVSGIERCIRAGIPVVLATRCIEGGVWPIYGYPGGGADLMNKGVINCGRLGGPKARLQLMLALGMTGDIREIRNLFE
ncbi:asparaginase [Salidesulfovibrio onnuriiensis]|uniref:asparaginase n=1 Tax=Salidesulfovibrio onnuriiensis TaxID=2583823 RepID=UPI0011CA6081|nr:asparaginase [Salidesulfovibrio onnuriiensis]